MKDLWLLPGEGLTLAPGEIHVWRISLVQPPSTLQRCRNLLCPEEVARADRFYFQRDRDRFVISHGALRQILALYFGARPEQLQFTQQEKGKPEVAAGTNSINLTFNLSHSGELALLAVALHLQLGVDVECVRSDFGGEEIAARFFSGQEVVKLFSLAAGLRNQAFFHCWTRKEAYIKAIGEGLSKPLESFDVAFAPGEDPALLAVRDDPAEASRWRFYDVQAGEGYAAALAVEGNSHQIKCWTWQLL